MRMRTLHYSFPPKPHEYLELGNGRYPRMDDESIGKVYECLLYIIPLTLFSLFSAANSKTFSFSEHREQQC